LELVMTQVDAAAAKAARPESVLIVALPGVPLELVDVAVSESSCVRVVRPVVVAPRVTLAVVDVSVFAPVPVDENVPAVCAYPATTLTFWKVDALIV
jgi:hypothetical protein